MKKILLSGILLLGVLAANAQRTSIGVTAGYGTAWLSDTDEDVTFNPAWNLGATLVYSTDTHWGFGADVKYSREGLRFTNPGSGPYNGQTITTKVGSDYIRVPIRAIYFFNKNDHAFRPNVSLGPSFGFLTGGQIRTLDGDKNLIYKSPVNDSFKAFDFGLQGTIGASYMVSDGLWLSADVVYYHGFIQQNKNGSNNMMNSNLGINLGLRFGIGN
ncbi:porin family protein [Cytophaga aurantiaca]|uniref:porin family protein n=1 Tax=Cytophaga aurantiaca TaxID=29530 RepID=UPI0003829540|nr:porin family protein [Cytophaga aurantiaca]